MTARSGYDSGRLQALQDELKTLNTAAFKAGLSERDDAALVPALDPEAKRAKAKLKTREDRVAARKSAGGKRKAKADAASKTAKTKPKVDPAEAELQAKRDAKKAVRAEKRAKIAPDDKGKAGAQRLLAMLGRDEEDHSPLVPGTSFTEAGVVRLMAHLRTPRSRRFRFRQRLLAYLTRPVSMGVRTAAGISVERLQVVEKQLRELHDMGWDRFRAVRTARRTRRPPSPLDPNTMAVMPTFADPEISPKN